MNKDIKIFGILNITPDSFSDGGKFLNTDKAITQAEKLFHDLQCLTGWDGQLPWTTTSIYNTYFTWSTALAESRGLALNGPPPQTLEQLAALAIYKKCSPLLPKKEDVPKTLTRFFPALFFHETPFILIWPRHANEVEQR